MKTTKIISLFLVLVLCLSAVMPSLATFEAVEKIATPLACFDYSVSDTGIEITKYIGTFSEVVIPNEILGYPVTSIGDNAFFNCTSLKNIDFGCNVESIGSQAFYGCSNLKSIVIPDAVKRIGDYAFYTCSSLTSVTIGNGVTSIGSHTFYKCIFLKNIVIGDSVVAIGDNAFYGCRTLTNVIIPDSAVIIGSSVFEECTSLKTVTMGNSVTSIGKEAFLGCKSLINIVIPNYSVTSIGDYAFYSCDSLKSIEIPDSVTSIVNTAFDGCDNLTIYGESGSYAETYANENDIPFVATDLSTTEPTVEPTATPLVTYEPTTEPTVAPTPTTTAVPFNYNIVDRKYAEITEYTGSAEEVVIPSKIGNYPVKNIANYAFSECAALTSVVICDSVTSVGAGAFYNCTALTSVTMGSGVESIGAGAFYNCTALNCVTIPDSVTQISNTAFKNCSNITIYGIEGSYAQTYAKTNDIPFVFALKTKSVLYAAYSIEKSINNNGKLPKYVTLDGERVYMPEIFGILAQYAAKAMSDFNSNALTSRNTVTFAETSYEAIKGTELTKAQYVALAQDVVEYMENNQVAPGSMETEIGTLSFETMLRIFAGVGAYARNEKKFPERIAVSKWVQILPTPPADGETTEYQYVAFDDILSGANFVQTAFEITSDIPTYVTVNGNRLYRGSMLAMFVKTVVGIDQGKASVLPLEEITVPSKVVDETITSCTLTKAEYLKLASRIAKSIDQTGALPKYCTTSYGTINTNNMIYIFARVLDSYKTNGALPESIAVQAWGTYDF